MWRAVTRHGAAAGVACLLAAAVACGQADSAPSGLRGRPAADGRAAVAKLASAQGDVRWQSAAAGSWTPARVGLALHPSDTVQTMQGAGAAVRFLGAGGPDEQSAAAGQAAVARLGPLTTLRIPEQAPTVTRLRQMSGRLVARLPQSGIQRMEVELPAGTLVLEPRTAGGTSSGAVEARVDVNEERTAISMVEGAARLERTHGGHVSLPEHHFVEVTSGGEVTQSGRAGAQAELVSPAEGATIRTRRETRFAWAKIPGAQSARVRIRPETGATRKVDVPVNQTEATVELESGRYSWTVVGIVDGEPMPASAARSLTVDLDRTPPPLSLDAPAPGATVSGSSVRVAGRTEPGAKLSVQGRELTVASDGTFSAPMVVPRGLTNIVVTVADDLGNTRAVSRAVLRE